MVDDGDSAQMNLARMEQLMCDNMSGSQLDLVMHGPGDPTAPGHTAPGSRNANVNAAFLMSEQNNSAKFKTDE